MTILATGVLEAHDSSWKDFLQVPIIDLLNQDKRPTFVVDLEEQHANLHQPIPLTFLNNELEKNDLLLDLVTSRDLKASTVDESDRQIFLNWVQGFNDGLAPSDFVHLGFTWTCVTLANRWRVFVATVVPKSCICTSHELKQTSSAGLTSTSLLDIHKSISHIEIDPSNRPSRPGSQTTSHSSKNLNPLARARNFFAGDSQKSSTVRDANRGEVPPLLETSEDLETDTSEASPFGIWSDVRTAKRNADLLAKVSSFDAVGISITNNNGEIVFANDAWYKICGLPHGPMDAAKWMSIFDEAEGPRIAEVWQRIIVQQEVEQFQIPLKWRWTPPATSAIESIPNDFPVWIYVWAYADISPDGETVGCCCVLTDISQQKWTESLVEQQLADAVERTKVLEQLSKDLAASETRFRRISDAMPHGIFMCNVAGNILYANDTYREIFPGSSDPTAREPWWTNVPDDELARAIEFWRMIREEHVKVSFEMSYLKYSTNSNGSTSASERRYMTLSAYPELDEQGEVKHITGCVTDISYLKNAEQAQGARADDAEESKRQLEQFIDMTSHEIRNPLSAIVHSAEEVLTTLRSYPDALTAAAITSAIDTAETIIDCTNHSKRIVDDILIVSKLDSGLLSIAPTSVRLVPAVKQALKMFDGEIRAAQITQTFTVDESFDKLQLDWVCLDISRVLQILVNLTTNAIKFTRPENQRIINTRLSASLEKPINESQQNGPQYLPTQIEASAGYTESIATGHPNVYVSISVIDSGCGLSEKEQKNLFRRFSQAGSRTHVKYGGTGLGLFISRQLCEMQGGQIGLQSTSGKGSVFTFYVKASKSDPPEAQHSRPSATGLHVGSQRARGSKLRMTTGTTTGDSTVVKPYDQTILLVEDNLVNQNIVAKMLRTKGFTVVVANHGSEALDRIRDSALLSGALATASPISLILLDIEMPVMDGLTCIRRIRKMQGSGELRFHVPVIATTANARQEQIDQAKEAGMDDVVTKPFRMDQLITVMTQLWEQYSI